MTGGEGYLGMKLDANMLDAIGQNLFSKLMPEIKSTIDNAVLGWHEKVNELKGEIKELKGDMDDISNEQVTILDRVSNLESVAPSIESIRDNIMPDISETISSTFNMEWNLSMINEVKRTENILILNAPKAEVTPDAPKFFATFCEKNLGMPPKDIESIEVKSVSTTGKSKNDERVTCFVSLGSVSQRNLCLKHAKNLKKGVSIDKSVPKQYLKKYRDYKSDAWKLRETMNVQTRIDFEGANLVLRYKNKENLQETFSWTIFEEFTPKPEIPQTRNTFTPSDKSVPTPIFSKEELRRTVIIGGVQEKSEVPDPERIAAVQKMFLPEENESIKTSRKGTRNTFVFIFDSIPSAEKIVQKYNGKVFEGKKISVSSF